MRSTRTLGLASLAGFTVVLQLSHARVTPDSGTPGRPQGQTLGLITVNTDHCNQNAPGNINQATRLLDAIQDANTIAHAGLIAADSPNAPPFNYFFQPSDNATVKQYLQSVINLTEDPSSVHSFIGSDIRPSIDINCNDRLLCQKPDQWGYTAFWGNKNPVLNNAHWEITLCDYGLNTLQRNPGPCGTAPPGSPAVPTLGWLGLKFLMQMWDTVGQIGDHTFEPSNCHALLTDGGDPKSNAESCAYMSSLAYGYGLKGDGPYYGKSCLGNWNPNPQLELPRAVQDGMSDLSSGGAAAAAS